MCASYATLCFAVSWRNTHEFSWIQEIAPAYDGSSTIPRTFKFSMGTLPASCCAKIAANKALTDEAKHWHARCILNEIRVNDCQDCECDCGAWLH